MLMLSEFKILWIFKLSRFFKNLKFEWFWICWSLKLPETWSFVDVITSEKQKKLGKIFIHFSFYVHQRILKKHSAKTWMKKVLASFLWFHAFHRRHWLIQQRENRSWWKKDEKTLSKTGENMEKAQWLSFYAHELKIRREKMIFWNKRVINHKIILLKMIIQRRKGFSHFSHLFLFVLAQ